MTSRETRNSTRNKNSVPTRGPQSFDLGEYVDKYNNLVELLFPLKLTGKAFLYVFRWQNYLLTLVVLVLLSILLYYPTLFLSFLLIMSILLMAVGKYYSQTKALSQLKKRVRPNPKLLDEDAEHFKRLHKEQKKSHKTLVEYKNIQVNIDNLMGSVSGVLDYFYKIILWKSPEVSVCVTILLVLGLVLVCTVYLRLIVACIPLVVLCCNGHFFKRNVDYLKTVGRLVYNLFRWRRRRAASGNPASASAPPPNAEAEGSAESVDGGNQVPRAASGSSLNAAASGSGQGFANNTGEAPAADSGTVASDSDDTTRCVRSLSEASASGSFSGEKLSQSGSKVLGFCSKCNTSFAKLLKRKHDCNYCGQSFCGSCTVKVKRALLGATSPAAFEESVRVCLDCRAKLTNFERHSAAAVQS